MTQMTDEDACEVDAAPWYNCHECGGMYRHGEAVNGCCSEECAGQRLRWMRGAIMNPVKLSPNRVREILAVSLRGDSMLGVDVEREELTSLAQEVCDLRTANGLLDSHIVSLEKDIADRDRQIADFIEWLKNHDPSPIVREMAERRRAEL